ncbi:O-antigen translocase [Actinobacillus equuli]|nr:O-antigen translocase [Actinobacillus equuli]
MKSLSSTTLWTAFSTAFKIVVGLLLIKLFALQFGTAGLGQVANFMTLITVLGVFAGAGILMVSPNMWRNLNISLRS